MLTAKSKIKGKKSSAKSWRAAAPSSRMRRRMASITPAITRNEAQTRPWKSKNPAIDSTGKVKVEKPKIEAR